MRSGTTTPHAKTLAAMAGWLLIALAVACSFAPGSTPVDFRGTTLTANEAAAPFTLTDQFGQSVSLSDFQGKVVLLTFLYTDCPDVCPITTNQLRETLEVLGDTVNDIAIVAISVDPDRDTVAAALDYSERWKMTDRWSYLVGTEPELAPVWKAYYMDPASLRPSSHDDGPAQESTHAVNSTGAGDDVPVRQSYLIIHSAPIFLIDQEGIARVVVTHPFDIVDLAHDVQALVDSG